MLYWEPAFSLNLGHRTVDAVECLPQKSALGKAFKQNAKAVTDYLSNLDAAAVNQLEQALAGTGWVL
jgi:hypothetical protein